MGDAIWWFVSVIVPAVVLGIATWAMRLLNEVHRIQREQLQIQQRTLAVLQQMAAVVPPV